VSHVVVAMANERVDSEIVSQFLLNTCRLRPQLSLHAVRAAISCANIAATRPHEEHRFPDTILLTTGSVAEFYIEPMLPCIGDIDIMFHRVDRLAMPRGHPPPTQLPAEFDNYVRVMEIVDSHLPGYVYLELRYLLTYSPADDKYNYAEYETITIILNDFPGENIITHGPAKFTDYSHTGPSVFSLDEVPCIRCLSWTHQAADWSARQRNYGWPDSATVEHVLSNGCDIVRVAHRQCRQHAWMGKRQFRLSFSRAEIVLLNSWMPVQQIVYHMLRFFVKTERLTESVANSNAATLSNYHIKTVMLWACEMKPRSWWTDGLNLVKTCVKLLHTLSVWLTDRRCQHYFISDCNLIDNTMNVQMIVSEFTSTNEACLSSWFVKNHIDKCVVSCPLVVAGMSLRNTVSAVVDWRHANSLEDLWHTYFHAATEIQTNVSHQPLTLQSCICWRSELTKTDARLTVYFSAIACLDVALQISRNGLSDKLMDTLMAVLGHIVDIQRQSYQTDSVVSLSKAAKLMNAVAHKFDSTVRLVETSLCKAYLLNTLRCEDSDSNSIYCLANVYLAVLYYTTGQYQTAIDHCTLGMRSQDHSQCSSHVVQGELLPKIDDDIDSVLGLAVFYQYVLSAALNQQQQRQYVSFFTTELFVYYLHIKLLSVTKCPVVTETSSSELFQRYVKCISEMHQLFIGDIIVFVLLSYSLEQDICTRVPEIESHSRFVITGTETETAEVVELLQKSTVEHLTICHQLEAQQFGSVVTIVTTDYEALYTYKHGNYQRCLLLSTQNVDTLLNAHSETCVVICEVLIQLLDDDIVSLIALMRIVNPNSRLYDVYSLVTQETLSLYLMTQCQLMLCHSVTSLAQTLHHIKLAQGSIPPDRTLDQLTLRLAWRKIVKSQKQILD